MITKIKEYKQKLILESKYFKDEEYYVDLAYKEYSGLSLLEDMYYQEYPDDDEIDDEKFTEYIKDIFRENIDEVLNDIYYCLEYDKTLYRKITVNEN